ncbi:E3 ubiquitin-protein ligase TRIM21 [Collichthys lucidus]|uniref:E3 ubiquitin-protein ligase TRIM21 n=1 Tax=Collichthys lucidus TaxID=240159 RepID=A0A4U5VXL5_COLLU|nr:E3 ubiquitin-protein ligase TRIM21 [Collichthys lucidus]
MSLQVCHCGWAKVTTYHGLRTHQGKMGCTPRGVKVEDSQQLYTWGKPGFTRDLVQDAAIKTDTTGLSIQVCHCGWAKVTTYHGLRTHQGMMGCTLKGTRIREREQYDWKNQYEEVDQWKYQPPKRAIVKKEMADSRVMAENRSIGSRTNSATIKEEPESPSAIPQRPSQRTSNQTSGRQPQELSTGVQVNRSVGEYPVIPPQATAAQPKKKDHKNQTVSQSVPDSTSTNTQANSAAAQTEKKEDPKSLHEAAWSDFSAGIKVKRLNMECPTTYPATVVRPKEKHREEHTLLQNVPVLPSTNSEEVVKIKEEPKSPFATPQHSLQRATNSKASHQLQEFGLGVQARLIVQKPSATTGQETAVQPKKKDKENQNLSTSVSKNVPELTSATAPMNAASAKATTDENPKPSCETSQLPDSSTGLKVKDLARMFAAITTQDTAVRPKRKENYHRLLTTSDMSLQVCHCCGWSKVTSYHGLRTHQGKMGCTPKGMRIPESEQFGYSSYIPKLTYIGPPIRIEEPSMYFTPKPVSQGYTGFVKDEREADTRIDLWRESLQEDNGPIYSTPVRNQPFLTPVTHIFNTQVNLATAEINTKETNKSLFEPQQHSHLTDTNSVHLSTVAQQCLKLHSTLIQPPPKLVERLISPPVHSSKLTVHDSFQGSLDTEWLEINNVFAEVMRVVEDAWKKALQPLEERRDRVKREAQDLIQGLQKEVDKLKMSIDELDKNPNLQISPLTGLDESRDWKNVTVDGSFSLGTLRSQTSNMMEEIQQKLEKLSSVVDVKLDPTTAHGSLILSRDAKKVADGGVNQKVPDTPERFDMFGSILGLNRLTSGKSYWEVEVSNKTGWDLGVARRNANRKGKLALTPDNGYWVIVHYEDKKYAALSDPAISLPLMVKPQKVGVFVDYEEGLVSFYDTTAQSHIYSFTECSFSDEIFPYFSPHLKQNGKNTSPLIISAVKKQFHEVRGRPVR